MCRQLSIKQKNWFTQFIMTYGHAMQAHRMPQSISRGFCKGLLGSETLAQEACRMGLRGIFIKFLHTQYPFGKRRTVTRTGRFDPCHGDNVSADAEDHTDRSAFIFLTADSNPLNNASEIMAWPMLSSTIWGIDTIEPTLW